MDINSLDLTPYMDKIPGFKLKKAVILADSYTVEDVIIVGLRAIDRDKKWYLAHNSETQAQKIAKLEAKIRELGGEPDSE